MSEIKNAKIRKTMLGYEDHGIFTFMLYLDYDSGGQGAGGYALDEYPGEGKRIGTADGMEMIAQVLHVVGVDKWEDLPGKHIRVEASESKVARIGHIIKDDWLNFDDFFTSWRSRRFSAGAKRK